MSGVSEERSRQVGPEFLDSGDPEWGEAPLREDGAFSGVDLYVGWGRWRERIYPSGTHPADSDPLALGRTGLRVAFAQLHTALFPGNRADPQPGSATNDLLEATTVAVQAVYEALEWAHSLHDYLVKNGRYSKPTEINAELGAYVAGALGARNASHHGLRRVVGFVDVPRPIYAARASRWVHTGTYADTAVDRQLRWVKKLPPPPLDHAWQEKAYEDHLAGREVRNTFAALLGFFIWVIDGHPVPSGLLYGPGNDWPPIGLRYLSDEERALAEKRRSDRHEDRTDRS